MADGELEQQLRIANLEGLLELSRQRVEALEASDTTLRLEVARLAEEARRGREEMRSAAVAIVESYPVFIDDHSRRAALLAVAARLKAIPLEAAPLRAELEAARAQNSQLIVDHGRMQAEWVAKADGWRERAQTAQRERNDAQARVAELERQVADHEAADDVAGAAVAMVGVEHGKLLERAEKAEAALSELREALESAWAAVGDRLLAKGPLSKEYAGNVTKKITAALERSKEAA